MTDDPRVEELLEELLDSGSTPDEACRNCPELLDQVRAAWRRLRALEAELGAWFPESSSANDAGSNGALARLWPTPDLPHIPGYEVQEVLGHGGMGIVYKAQHLRLNRAVALKMPLAGAHARPEELERFLREAEAVAGLRHANIVQVYEVGDVDGRPYFTMEFVEGGSLAQKMAGRPQPAGQAAALVAHVAEAIHVAHQKGIVHRDLKPGNILLTADGTPKVTDFGLARRLQGNGGLTLSGAAVGTPSYMAPEQVQGPKDALGPATDVYALGAILYELLTGRPPFRAETAAATMQQVLTDTPVPPGRFQSNLPRDLETICLKCLHKEPPRRYANAAALAEDLQRFLRGDPIAARRAGRWEHLVRWMRRRPALALLLVATVLLTMIVLGGGAWLIGQRTSTVRAVEGELREVVRLQQQSAVPEANAALERARFRLGDRGPSWMYPLLEEARRHQQFLVQLEAIRLNRSTFVEGRLNHAAEMRFNNAQADREYEEAFHGAGLCEPLDDPERVAAQLGASPFRDMLLAALDDWAVCSTDNVRQDWLLRVTRQADPDPWRDRVRDPAAWGKRTALAELARAAPVAGQPLSPLLALGERLYIVGGDGTGLLRRVQEEHPDEFWANFTLAKVLYGAAKQGKGDTAQAIVYYQKALQLRPQALAVRNDLGLVLYDKFWMEDNASGWGPGAYTVYHQALQSDPTFAPALNNLGRALTAKGKWEEAVPVYQDALRVNPRLAPAHFNLGEIQAGMGQINEAIDHYRQALQIDPAFAPAHLLLGLALTAKGLRDEVDDCYPEGVKILDEARGIALREAMGHYWQAFQLDPKWVAALNTLRVSPRDQARLNEAIDHYRQAIRIDPRLAQAHGALGQALLARRDFSQAEAATRRGLDWLPLSEKEWRTNYERQLQCCQRLLSLEGRLPVIVQGRDKPSAAECLESAELCYIKHHFAAAARLYAEAFKAAPRLTEELRAGHRFNAACAAALAGSGRGDDVASLGPRELTALRKQARDWLQFDLTAWARKLDAGTAADSIQARKTLSQWKEEPDLAGLRDSDTLNKLPPAEHQECRTLWNDVEAQIKRAGGSK